MMLCNKDIQSNGSCCGQNNAFVVVVVQLLLLLASELWVVGFHRKGMCFTCEVFNRWSCVKKYIKGTPNAVMLCWKALNLCIFCKHSELLKQVGWFRELVICFYRSQTWKPKVRPDWSLLGVSFQFSDTWLSLCPLRQESSSLSN